MLEFISPVTLRQLSSETSGGDGWLFPSATGHGFVRGYEQRHSKTAWRNYVAWYLCSAGFSTGEVASLLTLSESRVRAIVRKTRNRWLIAPWSIEVMSFSAKRDNLDKSVVAAHLLIGQRTEMAAAEVLLDRCNIGCVREVSAALRIGRETFLEQVDSLAGARCICRMCALLNATPWAWAYWDESDHEGEIGA